MQKSFAEFRANDAAQSVENAITHLESVIEYLEGEESNGSHDLAVAFEAIMDQLQACIDGERGDHRSELRPGLRALIESLGNA